MKARFCGLHLAPGPYLNIDWFLLGVFDRLVREASEFLALFVREDSV